jgi:hypothetical protein
MVLYKVQSQIVGSGSVTAGVILNDKDMVVHALQSSLISADTVPIIVAIAGRIESCSSPSAHINVWGYGHQCCGFLSAANPE